MGYNTRFELSVSGVTEGEEDEIFSKVGLDPGGDDDSMKWYDWEEDCCKVSKDYPAALLVLDGRGEEQGDVWRAFIRDGHSQVHKALEWVPPATPDPAAWKDVFWANEVET